jgi:hypothetical protein
VTISKQQESRHREILGDELVQLIDQRARLQRELLDLESTIYASLVNRVQSQSGTAMIRPYEALAEQLHTHDVRLDRKRTKIADLRMIVEDMAKRLGTLEERAVGESHDASTGRGHDQS